MSRMRKIVAPEASKENKGVVLCENGDGDKTSRAHRSALEKINRRINHGDLISVSDKVAGDPLFYRNYRWPEANRHYPEDSDAGMRFVSRYYPYADAKGGLYVDEPTNTRQVERCEEKRKIMKQLGLKYVVIAAEYFTPDGFRSAPTTIAEALEQLE
jgi:hypothetical protein